MNKLPPGAEMTPEKVAQIRERTAIQQIRSMRLWSLLKHFRDKQYAMLCPCATDVVSHPEQWDTRATAVVHGHPLYAALYNPGCRSPLFWEVTIKDACCTPAYSFDAVLYDHVCVVRPVDRTAPEWGVELVTLMAEFHPLESMRRIAIQAIWALGETDVLRGIAHRAIRDSYSEWLATRLAYYPDPWSNWVMRHCHLKFGCLQ